MMRPPPPRVPPLRTRRWGDSGQLGIGEALGVVAILLTLAAGAGSVINYSMQELNGPGKPDPIRPAALATFKAAPTNDCATRVLGDFAAEDGDGVVDDGVEGFERVFHSARGAGEIDDESFVTASAQAA